MSDTSTGACTSQKFIGAPGTVVVLGSGCSLGLGVPTLAGFLDHAFALLLRMVEKESKGSKGSSECPFQHMF
ncbi:MAG TPA: hypothetical protein HPQ00_09010, partial [Magnetococcales bacterium]|nr:hypothetical protein [Magnetococcales bacterium]